MATTKKNIVVYDGTSVQWYAPDSIINSASMSFGTGDLAITAPASTTITITAPSGLKVSNDLIFNSSSAIKGTGSSTLTIGQSGETVNLNTAATYNFGTITGNPTVTGNLTVSGNLIINGTTTTINATTLTVDDINIELGSIAIPTDATANGGGITLKGATDKTITWDSTTANWSSNQDFNVATGKTYKINNTSIFATANTWTTPQLFNTSLTIGTVAGTGTGTLYAGSGTFTGELRAATVLGVTSTGGKVWYWEHNAEASTAFKLFYYNGSGGYANTMIFATDGTLTLGNTIGTGTGTLYAGSIYSGSHLQDKSERYYTNTVIAGGWFRIGVLANDGGPTGDATFSVNERHGGVTFRIGASFNVIAGLSFTVLDNYNYNGNELVSVRVLTAGTNDPIYVEVYYNVSTTAEATFRMSQRGSLYGNDAQWSAVAWGAGSIPTGYTATVYNISNSIFAVGSSAIKFNIDRDGNATFTNSLGIGTTVPQALLQCYRASVGIAQRWEWNATNNINSVYLSMSNGNGVMPNAHSPYINLTNAADFGFRTIGSGAANFIISSTGTVIVADAGYIKSTSASNQDPYTGYQLGHLGSTFGKISANEMHVKSFIADIEQALVGGQIIAKSVAKLYQDFVLNAAIDATNGTHLCVEEIKGYTGQVFANSDYIRIRNANMVEGFALSVTEAWGVVTYVSRDNTTKTQTYSFLRKSGSTATFTAGTLAIDYGTSGCGILERVAISASGAKPYDRIATWTTAPYTDLTTRYQTGDLSGLTTTSFGTFPTGTFGTYTKDLYAEGNANIVGTISVSDGKFYAGKIQRNNFIGSNSASAWVSNVTTSTEYLPPIGTGSILKWASGTTARAPFRSLTQNYSDPASAAYMTSGRVQTISVYARTASASATMNIALNDTQSAALTVTSSWQRLAVTITPTIYLNLFTFLDIRNASQIIYLYGFQIEDGTSVTPYQQTSYALPASTPDYGMWSIAGGFGGTMQNPTIALSDAGMRVLDAGTTTSVAAAGTYIGRYTSSGYRSVVINSGGITGYTGVGSNTNFSLPTTTGTASIAGWAFDNSKLYTGNKTSWDDTNTGAYIGTAGIGIGTYAAGFSVSSAGILKATSAVISGAITATSGSFTGDVAISTGGALKIGQNITFNNGTSWDAIKNTYSYVSDFNGSSLGGVWEVYGDPPPGLEEIPFTDRTGMYFYDASISQAFKLITGLANTTYTVNITVECDVDASETYLSIHLLGTGSVTLAETSVYFDSVRAYTPFEIQVQAHLANADTGFLIRMARTNIGIGNIIVSSVIVSGFTPFIKLNSKGLTIASSASNYLRVGVDAFEFKGSTIDASIVTAREVKADNYIRIYNRGEYPVFLRATNIDGANGALSVVGISTGTIVTDRCILSEPSPTSSSAIGSTGEIRVDGNYIYVCSGTNTWKRALLSSW